MAVSVPAGTFKSTEGIPVRGAEEASTRVVMTGSFVILTGLGTAGGSWPHPTNSNNGIHLFLITYDSIKILGPKATLSPILLPLSALVKEEAL